MNINYLNLIRRDGMSSITTCMYFGNQLNIFCCSFSYQTGVSPNMANIQITAPDTMLQNPQPIQPNNIPNRQDDNQNVILDARGRVVENVDNDDELGQHDWLDYVYTFSRFMVLISIVYFYSNFTRFAIVALFFFIVYL